MGVWKQSVLVLIYFYIKHFLVPFHKCHSRFGISFGFTSRLQSWTPPRLLPSCGFYRAHDWLLIVFWWTCSWCWRVFKDHHLCFGAGMGLLFCYRQQQEMTWFYSIIKDFWLYRQQRYYQYFSNSSDTESYFSSDFVVVFCRLYFAKSHLHLIFSPPNES